MLGFEGNDRLNTCELWRLEQWSNEAGQIEQSAAAARWVSASHVAALVWLFPVWVCNRTTLLVSPWAWAWIARYAGISSSVIAWAWTARLSLSLSRLSLSFLFFFSFFPSFLAFLFGFGVFDWLPSFLFFFFFFLLHFF